MKWSNFCLPKIEKCRSFIVIIYLKLHLLPATGNFSYRTWLEWIHSTSDRLYNNQSIYFASSWRITVHYSVKTLAKSCILHDLFKIKANADLCRCRQVAEIYICEQRDVTSRVFRPVSVRRQSTSCWNKVGYQLPQLTYIYIYINIIKNKCKELLFKSVVHF